MDVNNRNSLARITQRLRVVLDRVPKQIAFALVFATVASVFLFHSHAATPTVDVEAEASTVSSKVAKVSDTTASGGNAVKFGQNSGTSRCPAYPAFPDANCTGFIPGSTLTSCNGNLTTNNATYNNCLFSAGVTLNSGVTGVKINNSHILGVVTGDASGNVSGLQMTDVEIDGQNADVDATNNLAGYSCTRCNVHDVARGFTSSGFTVTDSYVHDLYGYGGTGANMSHNEGTLISVGNDTIIHSNLVANFSSQSTGGGVSAVIAMYTHGSFWGPLDNIHIDHTRISSTDAGYCMYGGYSTDTDGRPSNIVFTNNTFVKNPNGSCGAYGPIVGWLQGNGNVWSGNTWSDGAAFPEPPSDPYQ